MERGVSELRSSGRPGPQVALLDVGCTVLLHGLLRAGPEGVLDQDLHGVSFGALKSPTARTSMLTRGSTSAGHEGSSKAQ